MKSSLIPDLACVACGKATERGFLTCNISGILWAEASRKGAIATRPEYECARCRDCGIYVFLDAPERPVGTFDSRA